MSAYSTKSIRGSESGCSYEIKESEIVQFKLPGRYNTNDYFNIY